MSAVPKRQTFPLTAFEQLREARDIIKQESEALIKLATQLDTRFCAAINVLSRCSGNVVVTGIGKAGLIGQKIAATFSSTGTRAHFMHPAEAAHGDLGCLHDDDVLLAFSNSGETEEICRLLPQVRQMKVSVVAVTASEASTLGRQADVTIQIGRIREVDPLGLAPSTSTTVMLALGDALAFILSRIKGLTAQQFAVFHPAGNLGRKLTSVFDIMRRGDQLRIANEQETIRQVFTKMSKSGRRTGAVIVVDSDDQLSGLFTDSDLARLLEQRRDIQLDRSISEVMTVEPATISKDATLHDAVEILSQNKFSELPVVDNENRPVGLIDITDVIGLMPQDSNRC